MRAEPLRQIFVSLQRMFGRSNAYAWAQPVTYLGVAMLVFIYCALTYLIVTDRRSAEYDAGMRGDNLARVVDKSFSHIFKSLDNNLLFLGKLYRQSPATFELSAWVHDASFKSDLTSNFMICDANGRVIDSSFSKEIIGTDRSGQDGFRAHVNSAADELLIGKPIILKFNGKWAIPVSRRLTAADGTFAGVITALLDPSSLIDNIGQIDLGPDGSIALVGLDSYLRTRSVNGNVDWENIGREVRLIPETLGRALKVSTGHYWSVPGVFNNVRRMVSYRVLTAYQQIAVVTIPEVKVFQRADENARSYWFIAATLTVVILIAIGFGAKREKKLIETTSAMLQTKDALRLGQERYKLVEAAVDDGIWDWNLLTDEDYFSSRWKGILGYAEDELPHTAATFFDLIHPDDKAAVSEAVQAHFEKDQPFALDFRLRHKDGDYRWVHSRGKAIWNSENRPVRMLGTITDITERKRTQAAVEESHANMARAEEMAHLGHIKYEKASGLYTWSDGVYRIMGKFPGSFTPTLGSSLELIHPDDRLALSLYRHNILSGLTETPITVRTVDIEGQTKYLEVWSAPLHDSSGAVAGMFGTVQDVTERFRADAAANESRENLARAEAMVLLGHSRADIDGNYTWSAGLYRIVGKSPQTYTPTRESARELIHPDDRAAHTKYSGDVMAGVDVPRTSLRMIRDDGEIIHVELWSVPIRDKDGNVTGKFSTLQDVTALRRTEALVSESFANLERAERLALLGHYKIDRGTGNLVWSNGIYRIFGLSPDTFTPTLRGAMELVHPEDRHFLKEIRDNAMSGNEIPHVTLRAIRSDGAVIDFEYWATPVRDSDGNITGVFGTVQDITIRKRAEEALARANQELEARVGERTAELAMEMRRREEAQMTLGQMQKMEAVGQLTAGIAHDFNNLLAVIGGSLEFVDGAAARGLTAEPELIDAALRATRRGRELVRRLLAFSRQSPLRAEATTIDQLVLDTLRLLQRTLGQGIDMVTQLDARAAVISVDRNQMANALLNLALNARDAMPDGGQLTIATTCRPAAAGGSSRWPTGEEVCITISDTGVGMTDDVRSRAFEPFFTTKPDGLGSGLGLSMVQGFVEQSGGKIDIDSEPGNGTAITIVLPRIASESRADEADPAGGVSANGREKTVLLVEDDPDVRVVTAAQLRHLGYKVHAVANGMEAIDLIASPANIDITLTDIVLPGGLDGVELIKEAMRARPRMGVLCMSGYDPTQKHRKWLKVQNINFLEKPFSSSRLAQALDAALAH